MQVRRDSGVRVCTQRVGLQTHAHGLADPLAGSLARRAGLPSVQGMAASSPSVCSLELLPGTLAGPRARCLLPGLLSGVRVWPYRPDLKPSAKCLQPGSCGPIKIRTDHFFLNQKVNPTPYNLCNFLWQWQLYYYTSLTHSTFSKKKTQTV